MSEIPVAAFDPIFWLHHAYVLSLYYIYFELTFSVATWIVYLPSGRPSIRRSGSQTGGNNFRTMKETGPLDLEPSILP
jgi:hypothetical protein